MTLADLGQTDLCGFEEPRGGCAEQCQDTAGAGRGREAACWLAEGPAEAGSSKLSVEAAGQSVAQSGCERCCSPVCLSSGPAPALLTSCQRGHSALLGVHSKQVLKQRGGHVWHHIQGPFGSCPHLLSTFLGTLGPGQIHEWLRRQLLRTVGVAWGPGFKSQFHHNMLSDPGQERECL